MSPELETKLIVAVERIETALYHKDDGIVRKVKRIDDALLGTYDTRGVIWHVNDCRRYRAWVSKIIWFVVFAVLGLIVKESYPVIFNSDGGRGAVHENKSHAADARPSGSGRETIAADSISL